MKKRITAYLLASLMILLTACGGGSAPAQQGGEEGASANPSTEAAEGEIILKYAGWDRSQMPVYDELFRQFEEENPGIKVVSEITAWKEYWTKLETAVTGKNAPDIFWLNIPRAVDYITNGVILPLDDLDVEFDKFPATHLEAYTYDGVIYGMPKDFDTMGLWYNKRMFDEAGLAYPTDDWTWDDLKENAAKLTRAEEGIYGLAADINWQDGYYNTIYQAGGDPFNADGTASNFDDPKTIAGVQFWADFCFDGSAPPMEVAANTPSRDMFDSGKVAMAVAGSYHAPVFLQESDNKDDFDVAMLPKGEKRACTSNALANVIYSGTEHPEAAKKLVEFLSTKEANEHVAKSGVVIPSYIGSQDAWVAAFPGTNAQALVDMVEYAVHLPNFPNSSAAIQVESEILGKAWSGQVTVEEACKEVAEKATAILNS